MTPSITYRTYTWSSTMKLLHVDSSINGAASVSRGLTRQAVEQWVAANPATEVEYLDLVVDTPPHFSADSMGISGAIKSEPTEVQTRENALSEALVSQFLAADVIVIGA